jgi:hypothetical protein
MDPPMGTLHETPSPDSRSESKAEQAGSLGWAASPRGRRELLFAGVFCAALVIAPWFVIDLFPFSQAPMFADAPREFCNYIVYDPQGRELPPLAFGVQRNYWGNPVGVGTGFLPPASVDSFGEVASEDAVREIVGRHLREKTGLPYVEVVQQVLAAVDDEHVGVRQVRRWRIDNPAGGRAAP